MKQAQTITSIPHSANDATFKSTQEVHVTHAWNQTNHRWDGLPTGQQPAVHNRLRADQMDKIRSYLVVNLANSKKRTQFPQRIDPLTIQRKQMLRDSVGLQAGSPLAWGSCYVHRPSRRPRRLRQGQSMGHKIIKGIAYKKESHLCIQRTVAPSGIDNGQQISCGCAVNSDRVENDVEHLNKQLLSIQI